MYFSYLFLILIDVLKFWFIRFPLFVAVQWWPLLPAWLVCTTGTSLSILRWENFISGTSFLPQRIHICNFYSLQMQDHRERILHWSISSSSLVVLGLALDLFGTRVPVQFCYTHTHTHIYRIELRCNFLIAKLSFFMLLFSQACI